MARTHLVIQRRVQLEADARNLDLIPNPPQINSSLRSLFRDAMRIIHSARSSTVAQRLNSLVQGDIHTPRLTGGGS